MRGKDAHSPCGIGRLSLAYTRARARSLGEFGATILFAGNFEGRTQTMPLAIYTALESDINAAIVLSAVLVATSFTLLLTFKFVAGRQLDQLF